jgi:Apolipoprotein N-acyltransferase
MEKLFPFMTKSNLVPFGEYFPLTRFLGYINFFGKHKLLSNGFSSGKGLKVTEKISVPPFVTLICYESLFSNEIIDKVNDAKWLVNITNDAWFGKKGGPNQHLAISRMRALENKLPLVRVANTGISAKVNKFGKVTKYIPVDKRGFIDVKINKEETIKNSLYNKMGKNISSYLLLLSLISILMRYLIFRKRLY